MDKRSQGTHIWRSILGTSDYLLPGFCHTNKSCDKFTGATRPEREPPPRTTLPPEWALLWCIVEPTSDCRRVSEVVGDGSLRVRVGSSLVFSSIHGVFIHTTLSWGGCSDESWRGVWKNEVWGRWCTSEWEGSSVREMKYTREWGMRHDHEESKNKRFFFLHFTCSLVK